MAIRRTLGSIIAVVGAAGALFGGLFLAPACSSSGGSDALGGVDDGGSGPSSGSGWTSSGSSGSSSGFVAVDSGSGLPVVCGDGAPCVTALAAGGSHICALLGDTTVRCWGENISGELGIGAIDAGQVVPSQTPTPTGIPGLTGVTQIAAGGYGNGFGTSCAAVQDGGVLCWGGNANGGLGLGVDGGAGLGLSIAPRPLAAEGVAQIALGGLFGCAVTGGGSVACWGDDMANELGRVLDGGTFDPTPTRVPLPSAAKAVATGKFHACAILSDQSVMCWGAADHGETGEVFDGGLATPYFVPGLEATQLAAGDDMTCAITTAGAVACWGGNLGGQLGRGDVDAGAFDPTPQPVALPAGATAVQIASAVGSVCALLSDRTVRCWGDNAYGELGSGSSVPGYSNKPLPVMGLSSVAQIAAGPGGWNFCALLQDGTVRCWGVNNADQLGVDTSGDAGPDQSPHPMPVGVPL